MVKTHSIYCECNIPHLVPARDWRYVTPLCLPVCQWRLTNIPVIRLYVAWTGSVKPELAVVLNCAVGSTEPGCQRHPIMTSQRTLNHVAPWKKEWLVASHHATGKWDYLYPPGVGWHPNTAKRDLQKFAWWLGTRHQITTLFLFIMFADEFAVLIICVF